MKLNKYDWETELKIIVALIIIALVAITVNKATETKTETRCAVVDCAKANDYYEITVESADDNNLYAYYDSVPRDEGTVIICTFKGEEIVDARDVTREAN